VFSRVAYEIIFQYILTHTLVYADELLLFKDNEFITAANFYFLIKIEIIDKYAQTKKLLHIHCPTLNGFSLSGRQY